MSFLHARRAQENAIGDHVKLLMPLRHWTPPTHLRGVHDKSSRRYLCANLSRVAHQAVKTERSRQLPTLSLVDLEFVVCREISIIVLD